VGVDRLHAPGAARGLHRAACVRDPYDADPELVAASNRCSPRRSSPGCAADDPEKLPPHRLRSPPRIGTPRSVGEAEAGVQRWNVEMMMAPEMSPAPRYRDGRRS
jgi:hypothetical protein